MLIKIWPAILFAILFFDITISNNLHGSKTVIQKVTVGVQNCFIFKNKIWCRKKIFTLNFSDIAPLLPKKKRSSV